MKRSFHSSSVLILLFLVNCRAKPEDVVIAADPRADRLQEIISGLEKETLTINRWESDSHHRAIEYAAREALDNFPNDPRAESWKWKLAYYAILAGDTQFGNQAYADLMEVALNSGEVQMDALPAWFHPGELSDPERVIPFELTTKNIASTGQGKKYLIQIRAFPGGSCFLASQLSQTYSVDLIYDGFPESGYSYVYDSLGCTSKDLTGDGNDEVVLEHYQGGHVGFSSLRIMDVSSTPMQLLPFASQHGGNSLVGFDEVVKDFPVSNGKNQLRTVDYAQNCQVRLEKTFEWSGTEFQPLAMEFQADLEYAPLKNCLFWSMAYARWVDLKYGVGIIDQALTIYGPLAMDDFDNQNLDRIRLEKGLLYLFENRPDEMRATFNDLIQNPYQENGIWVEPARRFLETYNNPSDIYEACTHLVDCVAYKCQESCSREAPCAREALGYMVEHQFEDSPIDGLVQGLQGAGVDVISNGRLDLDYDGRDELWFVVVPPNKGENSTNELWIASGYPDGIKVFSDSPGIQGINPEFHVEMASSGEVFVKYSEYWAFLWSRDAVTNEPNLRASVCSSMECYEATHNEGPSFFELRHQLQSGADPFQMYVEYMNLKKISQANLDACAECYFDLGYIAELVGDEKSAVEMYSSLIERFPDHPLTNLVKSKLEILKP